MAALPIIGNLLSGIFGLFGSSAKKKADQQAAQTVSTAGQNAQQETRSLNAASQNELNPFISTGQGAFSTLGQLMQAGTGGTGPLASWTDNFQAPTAAEAEATPGFQFQLQEGEKALESSAAARGGLLSAGTGKQLEQYGQGLASTNYQQVYNNAMQQYQQQYAQFQNNQSNLYNRLMGIGQTGLGATQTSVGANMQTANLLGNEGLTAAQAQAGYQAQAGGAKAIGIAGLGNSIGNAMGAAGALIPPQQAPAMSAPNYNVPGSPGFQPFSLATG